jgi:hypothetical protein
VSALGASTLLHPEINESAPGTLHTITPILKHILCKRDGRCKKEISQKQVIACLVICSIWASLNALLREDTNLYAWLSIVVGEIDRIEPPCW